MAERQAGEDRRLASRRAGARRPSSASSRGPAATRCQSLNAPSTTAFCASSTPAWCSCSRLRSTRYGCSLTSSRNRMPPLMPGQCGVPSSEHHASSGCRPTACRARPGRRSRPRCESPPLRVRRSSPRRSRPAVTSSTPPLLGVARPKSSHASGPAQVTGLRPCRRAPAGRAAAPSCRCGRPSACRARRCARAASSRCGRAAASGRSRRAWPARPTAPRRRRGAARPAASSSSPAKRWWRASAAASMRDLEAQRRPGAWRRGAAAAGSASTPAGENRSASLVRASALNRAPPKSDLDHFAGTGRASRGRRRRAARLRSAALGEEVAQQLPAGVGQHAALHDRCGG